MAYAASVGIGLDEAQLASVRRRAILACAIGNFFELFDFTIYGFFAVAISRAFYPSGSMYGTFAAFGAAFLMRKVAETPAFAQAVESRKVERSPLGVAFRTYGTRMLQAFGLSIIGCIANYVFIVYLVSYAINTMKLAASSALACAVAFGIIVMTLTPFVGMLSDRIGRRPLILACAVLNLLFDYPLFLLAIKGGTFQTLLLALMI